MLKDYWEKEKHLIQLVGILTGVGALFLSIAPPENLDAKQALANVQLVWLVIITISSASMFWIFYRFSIDIEKHLEPKTGIKLKETISMIIALSMIFVLWNLWVYIIKLYGNSLWNFLQNINFGIMAIINAVFFFFLFKYLERFKNPFSRISYGLTCYLIFSGSIAFISLMISNKGVSFSTQDWLLFACVYFIMLIALEIWMEIRRRKKVTPLP